MEPKTPLAFIVMAADAISAARPGARRESLENYIKRLEKLEAIANDFAGVEKSFAIQSGREIRIMVKPEDVTDEGTKVMAKEIAKRIERELEYPGQIRVNVIRETRSTPNNKAAYQGGRSNDLPPFCMEKASPSSSLSRAISLFYALRIDGPCPVNALS